MPADTLKSRVARLEQEVACLKAERRSSRHSAENRWWERIAGTFANDPLFEQAMRYGRRWRQSQRPKASRNPRGKGTDGHP